MNEFKQIKQKYTDARAAERKKIVDYLITEGFETSTDPNSGSGSKEYTSGGKLNPPFDLSNSKYIEAKKDGIKVFISLQAFDYDPVSKTYHVLMDRIGVYVYKGKFTAQEVLENMVVTHLELPLEVYPLAELIYEIDHMIQLKRNER